MRKRKTPVVPSHQEMELKLEREMVHAKDMLFVAAIAEFLRERLPHISKIKALKKVLGQPVEKRKVEQGKKRAFLEAAIAHKVSPEVVIAFFTEVMRQAKRSMRN